MKMSRLFAGLLTAAAVIHPLNLSAQIIESQTFANSSTAAAAGWLALRNNLDGNAFGFANSNFTGGLSPAGEAGGTFARTTNLAYYADLTINGNPNLGFYLQATGELAITNFAFNNGIRVGFFDANDVTGSIDFVGFQVAEPVPSGSGMLRAFGGIHLSDGSILENSGSPPTLIQGGQYTWTMNWNPLTYQLVFELFNSGGTSQGVNILALDALTIAAGVDLNAFGIFTGGVGGASPVNVVDVYVDNLTYSFTPVPEPGSLALCGLALAVTCRRLRKSMVGYP